VQTTLLGLAIAIILALVSALVAPLVVDWNRYRPALEQEAMRLTGLAVRVNGTIDARILPTPRIVLRNVDVAAAGQEPKVRAATLELELGLGPLLRGKVQATEMRLVAPQISVGLDHAGALDWLAISPSWHADRLTISRLSIEDGRVVLTDANSAGRLVLQKLWFKGDVRSFSGPFRGEGAFVVDEELYGFRVSGVDEDGGVKLRLGLDPSDYPLTTEIEGLLSAARGVPQFEGTLVMARPVAAALTHGERVLSDPWHLGGRLRATPASASLQDLAFQYGPEDRAVNFSGEAALTFGAHPHLDGAISARQVDVDRALASPDVTQRPPFQVIKAVLERFVAAVKPPVPTAIAIGVDAVTVGGTSIESLHGSVRFDGKGWSLNDFEFHAPGFTEVKLSGRLDGTAKGLAFSGPASLQSGDLKTLVARLEGRGNPPAGPVEAFTARGDVTIAGDRFALDRMTAALDQDNVEGRLAYSWAAGNRPAVLDSELHAAKLDVDAMMAFAKATLSDAGFEVPREVALVLDIGKAKFAGVDARTVNARLKFDAGILHIDRLSVGDLGGTALDISGRIDELSSQPRGRLTLDLDAKSLAGLASLVGSFAPQPADLIRGFADRLAPAKVHGVLTVEHAAPAGSIAKLDLNGTAGALRVALNGQADGEPDRLGEALVRVDSRFDADDGGALIRLIGLDRVLAVDQLPGQMTISAAGPIAGAVRVNGLAVAGGFSTTVEGALRLRGDQAPNGSLQVKASAADMRPLQRAMTGQPGAAVPVSASATVAVGDNGLSFTNIAVAVGKESLRGRLALKLSRPIGIDGDVEADDADAAALSAMLFGLPSATPGSGAPWSSPQPIGAGAFGAVNGTLTFTLKRAAFTPSLVVRDFRGVARFEPAQISVSDIDGSLAGGRLTGTLGFHRNADALAAQGRVALAGADAARILPSMAIDGLLTVQFQAESMGLSPEGLVGSLHGSGSIALADAHFIGIDVAAFDAAVHAADQGGAIDASKIRAAVTTAIDNGRLAVPQGAADVTIAGGQIHLTNAALQAQDGAELAFAGVLDLGKGAIDARMTLSGRPAANALTRTRPELAVIIKGPLATPERTLDVSALVGWLTLRAAELQTRRLESIEANRRQEVIGPVVRPVSPAIRFVPLGTALESSILGDGVVGASPGSRGLDRLQPQGPGAAPDGAGAHPESAERGAAAAALPAPLEIVPIPQRSPPRADNATASGAGGTTESNRHRAVPLPSARPPLDFLFRSQN